MPESTKIIAQNNLLLKAIVNKLFDGDEVINKLVSGDSTEIGKFLSPAARNSVGTWLLDHAAKECDDKSEKWLDTITIGEMRQVKRYFDAHGQVRRLGKGIIGEVTRIIEFHDHMRLI